MTPATDDPASDRALEAAFEAVLAGRRVPPAAEGLAAFADGVRATAARPPRPSAALADLLATGLLTDQSSAPAPRAVRSPRRSTRRMFLAFFAKFAAAGVAAKTVTVAGVVVVGVSTAGFTGALPDDLQHGFASVVDTATPLTAPEPATATPPATTAATTSTTTTGTEAADASGTSTAPVPGSDAGAGTGTATTAPTTAAAQPTSTHPDNFGGQVSSLAHQRNEARRSAATSAASTAPATATADDADENDDSDHEDSTGSTGTSGGEDGHGSSSGSHGKGHGDR